MKWSGKKGQPLLLIVFDSWFLWWSARCWAPIQYKDRLSQLLGFPCSGGHYCHYHPITLYIQVTSQQLVWRSAPLRWKYGYLTFKWVVITQQWWEDTRILAPAMAIGIYHDTVCARVVAAAPAGTTSAVPDCSTNHDSADRIVGQFLFYHNHNFTKSEGNLCFRRLVPLFVPIGVCVTTHDDGTASDVTIGMWRHNQQVTNHERNGKPCFSLPK